MNPIIKVAHHKALVRKQLRKEAIAFSLFFLVAIILVRFYPIVVNFCVNSNKLLLNKLSSRPVSSSRL